MWIVGLGLVIGLVVGATIGHDLWIIGAAAGALVGWALNSKLSPGRLTEKLAALSSEVKDLGRRLAVLETQFSASTPPATAPSAPASSEPAWEPEAATPLPVPERVPEALTATRVPPREAPASEPRPPVEPAYLPPEPAAGPNPIIKWLLGGNTVVRVGVVILFFGVAFLLKYAYEHTHVPIEVRLVGVALGAFVLLVLGWRLRDKRPGYALSLQGAGIAVLYLTIFAAFRLYALLPPLPAFVLLVAVAAFSAALAVLQNSLALAVIGASGGFLAPVLASTGRGSHVMLFSYYLVLNLGIFAIAWRKAWRVLNLVGFGFTFVIGTLWGVTSYRPDFFASTEPFLAAFFLLYVAIPILYAKRESFALRYYVDGTLVFGVPLVAFGLQTGLVRQFEYGAAWSAFVLGAFYLTLASALWRRAGENLRLLTESFLALGVGFGTLAIPLAFDGRITSAAWALEGAAIVWVSARQARVLGLAFGLALQFAAGIAFLFDVEKGYGPTPVLNSFCLGCVFVALGGLFCSAYLERRRGDSAQSWEPGIAALLLGWGALWWAGGGLHEIHRHLGPDLRAHAALIYLASSAAVFSLLSKSLDWQIARWPAYTIAPIAALVLTQEIDRGSHPFTSWGWLAWPLAWIEHLWVLRRHEQQDQALLEWLHAIGLWLLTVVACWEFAWQIDHAVEGKRVWPLIAWAVVPALILALLTAGPARRTWPVSKHEKSYLLYGAVPLAAFLAAWTIYANFTSNGDPAPLPYLPLLNPLDIAQALVFVVLAQWLMTLRSLGYLELISPTPTPLYALFGGATFIWANGVLLRTLHHWAGVPFELDAMLRSVLVQAAFSLFWSILALAIMVFATRRALRGLWITGAALMGVVVIKLFLVELSHVGTVERIVSFIGVGIFLLVIGYFSPVPPRLRMEDQK
jgi:uncharacterized membrane protein